MRNHQQEIIGEQMQAQQPRIHLVAFDDIEVGTEPPYLIKGLIPRVGLKAVMVPDNVREVVILADGDDAGESAAQEAAERFLTQGREVRIARPPTGKDFNDLLDGAAP